MARSNRPIGREKRVGSGSGRVEKRGSGIGRGNSGPVGGSGGFFNRRTTSNIPGSTTSSSGSRGPTGGISKVLIIVVVAVIYYFFSKMGDGGGVLLPGDSGNNLPGIQAGTSTYDGGAYAVDRTVASEARPKRTTLVGGGRDRTTIMVYLLGTDLESRSGMATMDLQEMLDADLSENVKIVVETGGTAQWKNDVISNRTNQRYLIDSQGLRLLEDDLGRKSMVDPNTLTEFIRYSEKNFPAERYILIFWDHGGGSVTGYGYDEYDKGDTMTLDEIERALFQSGTTFDLIGFDACLMATMETAFVAEPYADYLIASEELEPGIGWYYTGWLNALSRDPSMETIDLGKVLIDDYIREVKSKTPKSQATLSLVDLAELGSTVPPHFSSFAQNTGELIETENYKKVSDSRAATKEFASSSRINQIDLIDFATKLDTPQGNNLATALDGAVKYNRMSENITNANGLSIFFPYGKLSDVSSMLNTYEAIGMDEDYSRAIKSFANLNAGGQMATQGGGLLETLLGGGAAPSSQGVSSNAIGSLLNAFLSQGDFSSITGAATQAPDWLDSQQVTDSTEYYSENMIDPASIDISIKDGQRVLELTEEEWDLVHTMELSVFIDDGEGFIDLGRDNVFEYNEDGDLILEYDGTWLAINDRIVSYYMTSYDSYGDTYKIMGRVPILLNGQLADMILSFDQGTPYGEVLGAQIVYDTEVETPNQPKGLLEIEVGDRIDYLCDYYSYQGEFDDTYYLGDPYEAEEEWYIENLAVTNLDYLMSYKITDIYGNSYWTPPVRD
ncbi:peptidase C11 [Alkalibacter rhizosphaerae]|uniref:Peptidase C11 n=1 Tax=Alkalibacter rhizosphaerae TaxID=2815577 RepID=A0A974XET6_9FIRM|nr:clostripain-related cysteine peptidase [Alkalibacter rhizosphaerae]QSX08503.1 peptidase C11 [Alkalibacter rhizosphaerae]